MNDPTHASWAIGAATAALIAFLSFSAGGFFPGTTSLAAAALLLVLLLVTMLARNPGAAIRGRLVAAVVLLALFALWQLISSSWSDAPGRAVLAFNLTLLYVLVMTTAGLVVDRPQRVRALVYGTLAGLVVTCLAGLLSRTLPELITVAEGPSNERLNFPLTYWNAVGIMAATAIVLCLGITGSRAERPLARIATAAAVPPLAATVLLTFSRGSIAAGCAGIVLMVVLAPRRHLICGFLAAIPPAIVALVATYRADALAQSDPTTAEAVSQGKTVILVVVVAAVAAGLLRALLIRYVDARFDRTPPATRRTTALIAAGVVVASIVVALALSVPDRVDRGYDRFLNGSAITSTDLRDRLTDPANNGRLEHWRVALDAFDTAPLRGTGAGTYQVWWNELREDEFDVLNAHSLYLEVLAETGVVGLIALVLALLALIGGAIARTRGPEGPLWAAVSAAMVTWLLEAGIDWTWQMPATSVWFFALGAAALARPFSGTEPARGAPRHHARLIAGVAILIVGVTPVRIALSQNHLDSAVEALQRGDCKTTVSEALSSARLLGARPEPYELLAYCDARLGFGTLALEMADRAIARDPRNWEYRYDRALVLGIQGRDPRPDLALARRLNPLENRNADLQEAMAGNDPQTWRRRALNARLLLPER